MIPETTPEPALAKKIKLLVLILGIVGVAALVFTSSRPDSAPETFESIQKLLKNPEIIDKIQNDPDIAGGVTHSNTRTFPFAVAITKKGSANGGAGTAKCSGVVVHKRWVLTSAHCIEDQDELDLQVVAGASPYSQSANRQIVQCKEFFVFDQDPKRNDVGLVHLKSDLVFNRYVKKIPRILTYRPRDNSVVTAVGYGRHNKGGSTPSDRPQKSARMNLKANAWCRRNSQVSNFDAPRELCLSGGNGNTCAGDSGGPIVYGKNLLAINSRSKTSCSNSGNVDVCEAMPYYYRWISITIAELYGKGPVLKRRSGCMQLTDNGFVQRYKRVRC